MRETRYLWISNLPAKSCEDDVRSVLESHGKIQSVRIQEYGDSRSAVVAFMDTKSATKALEFVNKLDGVILNLEYCESTGIRSASQLSLPSSTNVEKNVLSGNNCSGLDLPRNEDRKGRSPDRNLRPRSRSTSVSSTPSEISSVTGSTMRRSGRNNTDHKSGDRRRSDANKYRSSSGGGVGPQDDHSGDSDATYCWTGGGGGGGNGTRSASLRGLRVTQLPMRSTDSSIREGLFHEYKKQGKITSVVVEGQGTSRYAVITFKRVEDAEKALDLSKEKVFFATVICVERHNGYDEEDPDLCPPELAMDEYHPKASKTLFVGNLPTDLVTEDDLLKNFEKYGEIIDIDIKQQTNQTGTSYAFIQFTDIKSVVRALNSQDHIRIGGKIAKLGFGKSQPTCCIWLDNLASSINEHFLMKHFKRFGPVTEVVLDKKLMRALVFFETVDSAKEAWLETRKFALAGRKVHIDYANTECQDLFDARTPRPRTLNHGTFATWNHENYRQDFHYLPNYINWSYGKNMVPFVPDERRRRFEEIRVHEDCDPVYRGDQFRDGRWSERQGYAPAPGSVYDYRQGSASKRQRYPEEMRSSSITGVSGSTTAAGINKKSTSKSESYQGGSSRIRSESPYSSSKSRSRDRDKASSSRMRGEENEDDDEEDIDAGHSRRSRDKDRGHSDHKSGGRSHRSSSLADKSVPGYPAEQSSPQSRHSSTRRGGDSVPPGSSDVTAALENHVSSGQSLVTPPTPVAVVPVAGGEQSVECLSDLERERQLLLMELSKLEKDKDEADGSSGAVTVVEGANKLKPSCSVDSALAKRKVKHELRDVFDYDHLHDSAEHRKLKSTCVVVEGGTSLTEDGKAPVDSTTSSNPSTGCDNNPGSYKFGIPLGSTEPSPSSQAAQRTPNPQSQGPCDVVTPTSSSSSVPPTNVTSVQSHILFKELVDSVNNTARPTISIHSRLNSENSTSTPLSASHIPSSPTSSTIPGALKCFDFAGIKTSPTTDSPPVVSRDPRLSWHRNQTTPVKLSPVSTTPPILSTSVELSPLETRRSKQPRDNNSSLLGSSRDDDSEASDVDNEKDSKSLEERIRRLDDKIIENKKVRTPTVNYSKFTIRKKVETVTSSSQPCSVSTSISVICPSVTSITSCVETKLDNCRTDTTEFVKNMLHKQSIFDRRTETRPVLLNSEYSVGFGGTSLLSGIAVQQPLTIGVSTGDSSTPSSLSSPGSVSLPVRNSLFNYIHPSLSTSQDSTVGLTQSALTPSLSRTNCKLEACISSGISPIGVETKFVETNTPTRSILKKESLNCSGNPFHNNNNNTSPFLSSDSNGLSLFQRHSRPLPSPGLGGSFRSTPTNGLGGTRNDGSLSSPSLHTPPAKGPDSNSSLVSNPPPTNSVSPSPSAAISTLAGAAISKPGRPGQPNPSPKNYTAPSGGDSTHKSSNYDSKKPLINAGLNSTPSSASIKRKVHDNDESKKSKISKLDNKPVLDDSFMNNPHFFPKDKKQHKKVKPEIVEESKLTVKKVTTDISSFNKSKISVKSEETSKSELKKLKKHSMSSEEKAEKHKRKKEKLLDHSNSVPIGRMEMLFGKIDDEDRKKKLKKKHQKELKAEGKMDFKSFEERHKKEKKKHSHDREKFRNCEESKLSKKSTSPSVPKRDKSLSKFTDREISKKKKNSRKEKEKTHDSDTDDGWRLALQAVAAEDAKNWSEISPYESMYDKIKRRASKEAEKKQVPGMSDGRPKKNKHKKSSSKIYTTDSEAEHSDSIMSSLNEEASKSSARKSKSGKSGRSKSSKRNVSDDDLSDFPVSTKRNRLDGGVTDNSSLYSSSKLKKKSKKISEEGGSRTKLEGIHKSKKRLLVSDEKIRKSKSEKSKHSVLPKSRATVDSVFSDSSDTSRASSPVRGFASLPDHSSDESKTTPSTEPMENSEGESNSNRRKSTEDDWKSSLPSSPLQEELDHGLRHSSDKKKEFNETITISEDLPCLEKQPDEELVGESPRSIDDGPPDHLESIYDSPLCSVKDDDSDQVIEEHIVYDNMETSIPHDEEEQSLAIASILDKNDQSKSFDSPSSKTASTTSCPAQSEKLEKQEPTTPKIAIQDPAPPKLPIEVPVILSTPKVSPPVPEIPVTIPVQAYAVKASPIIENKEHTIITTPPASRCQMPTQWDTLVQTHAIPKSMAMPQLPFVPHLNVPTPYVPPPVINTTPVVTTPVPRTTVPQVVHNEINAVTAASKVRNTDTSSDSHDYTSYVQSVIERVKQEKDEESNNNGKTGKRQKKYAPGASSTSSVGGSTNWQNSLQTVERRSSIPSSSAVKKSSPAADLKPLVPQSVPPIPGVNVCTPVQPQAKTPPQAPALALSSSTPLSRTPGTPIASTNPALLSSQIVSQMTPIMTVTPVGMHPQSIHYAQQQLAATMPLLGAPTSVMAPLLAAQHMSAGQSHMLEQADQSANSALSPQSSIPLGNDDRLIRRRPLTRRKRSDSLSKSSDKPDLLNLEETINDVVRKSREGSAVGEDGKRSEISANSSHSCNESAMVREMDTTLDSTDDTDSKCGSRLHPIDPYEPNFDESPPEPNLNRDLHRSRPPAALVPPSIDIPGSTSSESAIVSSQPIMMTCTATSLQPPAQPSEVDSAHMTAIPQPVQLIKPAHIPNNSFIIVPNTAAHHNILASHPQHARDPLASLDQVINDVVQGKFDPQEHLELNRQRPHSVDDRTSVNSPHPGDPLTATVSGNPMEKMNLQQQQLMMANLVNSMISSGHPLLASMQHLQQPISPQSQQAHIQMIPTSVAFGQQPNIANAVQLGVVNSQPYTTVQAVEERGYPIERVPNPGLGPLTIGTSGMRPGSVGASTTTTSFVHTAARDTFPGKAVSAMASPVLVSSRPSSNPTGRSSTASYYPPTTPEQNISPTSQQPRPGLVTTTGQSAYRPPGFDGNAIRTPLSGAQDPLVAQNLFFYTNTNPYINLTQFGKPLTTGSTTAAANLYTLGVQPTTTSETTAASGGVRPASQQQQQQQQQASLLGLSSIPAHLYPGTSAVDWISDKMTALDPRYRMVWKGRLALKNEEAHVQMHYVHGNNDLIKECMSLTGHSMEQPLKIVQRMRLEPAQLEGVQRKMQQESDFCICLALATGSTPTDQVRMSSILRDSFIKYMQDKVAAGIINVCHPEFQHGLYVVHIFPPCEFSNTQLRLCAPDLLQQINQHDVPHLLVVITTV